MNEYDNDIIVDAEIEAEAFDDVWEKKLASFAYVGIATVVSYLLIASFALINA